MKSMSWTQNRRTVSKARDTYLKSVLQLKRCKECGIHWLDMSPQKRSGRTWIEISEWRMATFHQGELHLDQIPLATR
jgi:hypothetical protein